MENCGSFKSFGFIYIYLLLLLLSIYTYKTETFEAPTNFHVSIILKKKKHNKTFLNPDFAFPFHKAMPKAKPAPQILDLHL